TSLMFMSVSRALPLPVGTRNSVLPELHACPSTVGLRVGCRHERRSAGSPMREPPQDPDDAVEQRQRWLRLLLGAIRPRHREPQRRARFVGAAGGRKEPRALVAGVGVVRLGAVETHAAR